MNQLGNLAIVCALRPDSVKLVIYNRRVILNIGDNYSRRQAFMAWDDNEKIEGLIRELNYGKLTVKGVKYGLRN